MLCIHFVGIYGEKSGRKRFGNLHWRAWKNAGFCHVRSPGNLSVASKAWWSLSFTTFCFLQKNLPEVQDFFFSLVFSYWRRVRLAKWGCSRKLGRTEGREGQTAGRWCRGIWWQSLAMREQSSAGCTSPAPVWDLLGIIPCPSPFSGCSTSFPHLLVTKLCGVDPNISVLSNFIGAQ